MMRPVRPTIREMRIIRHRQEISLCPNLEMTLIRNKMQITLSLNLEMRIIRNKIQITVGLNLEMRIIRNPSAMTLSRSALPITVIRKHHPIPVIRHLRKTSFDKPLIPRPS